MTELRTVGDLRKLVAQLDAEHVADDVLLARRGHIGGSWANGFDDVSMLELVTYGRGSDKLTVETSRDPFTGRRIATTRSRPFKALAFD